MFLSCQYSDCKCNGEFCIKGRRFEKILERGVCRISEAFWRVRGARKVDNHWLDNYKDWNLKRMLAENGIAPVRRRLTQLVQMRGVQRSKWKTFTHIYLCPGTATQLIGSDCEWHKCRRSFHHHGVQEGLGLIPGPCRRSFKCHYLRCILRGPGGERIVDVVPGGTELEPLVKTGSWAGFTHSQ
jgi:hypothetical protein